MRGKWRRHRIKISTFFRKKTSAMRC